MSDFFSPRALCALGLIALLDANSFLGDIIGHELRTPPRLDVESRFRLRLVGPWLMSD